MATYLPIASSGARSRPSSPRFPIDPYDTESLSSDDANASKTIYTVPTQYRHHYHHHHHHVIAHATNSSSNLTSAYQTPTHSRPSSPAPRPSGSRYFYSDEDQTYNPLLPRAIEGSRGSSHRKWFSDSFPPTSRRSSRRRTSGSRVHGCRRALQVIVESPLFPAQPATIVSTPINLFLHYTQTINLRLTAPLRDNRSNRLSLHYAFSNVPLKPRQSSATMAFILCNRAAFPCRRTQQIPTSWCIPWCYEHRYRR